MVYGKKEVHLRKASMSLEGNRTKRRALKSIPLFMILIFCVIILAEMAVKSNTEFDFRYWPIRMQLESVAILLIAAFGLYDIWTTN
jgi:hypothetical protein